MLYVVSFRGQADACAKQQTELESVELDYHGSLDGAFWQHVFKIVKSRKKVHPTVAALADASPCEAKEKYFGLWIGVYEAARHPMTRRVERCNCVLSWKR